MCFSPATPTPKQGKLQAAPSSLCSPDFLDIPTPTRPTGQKGIWNVPFHSGAKHDTALTLFLNTL